MRLLAAFRRAWQSRCTCIQVPPEPGRLPYWRVPDDCPQHGRRGLSRFLGQPGHGRGQP